jgi:flavin-dependent dehydrogenase
VRRPVAPGLALIGDAALATDPLFGVGCGWAFQSGEWLADAVGPGLRGEESLERGLKRYRRTHRRRLAGHAYMIHDYADGRPVNGIEKMLFSAADRDPKVAAAFDAFATRRIGPGRMFARAMPRALALRARGGHSRQTEDQSRSDVAAA